ncbi:MAG: alcohol dehydrogenase catalytic domain-containing protein, partial [Actinomycetota bacterium]|nr:alcohol dehydrogenase catalytic domain-containing protein [Actinomycetota bacterium]
MKAVRFSQIGGPEVLEIVDLPDPHPGPGQVRIAVRAAGLNPSDWKKRRGLMDSELPQTMGHEAAGVVDELGEGARGVEVGDRVFGFTAEEAAQADLPTRRGRGGAPRQRKRSAAREAGAGDRPDWVQHCSVRFEHL